MHAVPAPTGTLALIFTDVEGSTALWEHVPEAMREGLGVHDAAMRRLLDVHRGYEVKTEGDAFMVAFQDPADAVAWCLAVQDELPGLAWPPALLADPRAAEVVDPETGVTLHRGLRVRMGGHVGEPDCRPDPVTGRMDYFGPMVNRSARVGGAGHGGQVVLSRRLWDRYAGRAGTDEVTQLDLGLHGMKGLKDPEELVQVLPRRLAARRFPPLKTQSPRRTNLRAQPTEFVGREAARSDLAAALDAGPLTTLLGPGGMGKTRLAREVGLVAAEGDAYPGGVWFCDLAPARTRDDLLAEVAAPLGVSLAQGHSFEEARDTLSRSLAGRGSVLLLLDNFEQLVDHAAETVGAWLAAAPALRCLVTSRAALGLASERRVDLDPLPPGDGARLFELRARAAKASFALDDATREAVGALVERLEGMPLALELAAARVRLLPPAKLLARLEKSLDVLKGGPRDAAARQRTLRATLEWSWDLLDPAEQRAFAWLAVFRGRFTVEDAEAVLGEDPDPLELLESLGEKSLLREDPHPEFPEDPALRMLVPLREFATEKLAGEEGSARDAHAARFRELGAELVGADLDRVALEGESIPRVEMAREDLEAAFEHLVTRDPDAAAEVALALGPLFGLRGPAARQDELLAAALAAGPAPALAARLRRDRAEMLFQWTRLDEAEAEVEAVLGAGLEDPALAAEATLIRAACRSMAGRYEEAEADAQAGLRAGEAAGDLALQGRALAALGGLYLGLCSWENAREYSERAVRAYRELGSRRLEAMPLLFFGFILWESTGDADATRAAYQRALAIHRETGNRTGEAMALQWLAEHQLAVGELADSRATNAQAIPLAREYRNPMVEWGCEFNLAAIDFEEGNLAEAGARIDACIEAAAARGDPLMEGALLFFRGAIQARRGALEDAGASFEVAHTRSPPSFVESQGMRMLEAYVDLSRARQAKDPTEAAGHLARVRAALVEAVAPGAEDPEAVDLDAASAGLKGNKISAVRVLRGEYERARVALEGTG